MRDSGSISFVKTIWILDALVEFQLNTIFAAIQMNVIMMRFIASLVLVIGQVGVKAQLLRPRALSLQKIATYTPRKCATSDGRSNVVDPANI